MRVKELDRCVHTAWASLPGDEVYLATNSAEIDADTTSGGSGSSPSSKLELFKLDLKDSGFSMKPDVILPTHYKSTCLCWTPGFDESTNCGLLISGTKNGSLFLYNPKLLLSSTAVSDPNLLTNGNNDGIPVVTTTTTSVTSDTFLTKETNFLCGFRENVHSGLVSGLDFNRFQPNLFASISDELFIWDVNKMEHPMVPGSRQDNGLLCTVAWNPRVQHILCTTSSEHCVIWDLRKSDSVVQLNKSICQFEPKLMCWSPITATRLCLADPNGNSTGEVQLWDLRYLKQKVCLICHWPSVADQHPGLNNNNNKASIESLCWAPNYQTNNQQRTIQQNPDPDLILMTVNTCGRPLSAIELPGAESHSVIADFLVVSSVQQAIESVEQSVSPLPVFIGHLDRVCDTNCSNNYYLNTSVHWIPNNPNLVCVTQPTEGWITVCNLTSGPDIDNAKSKRSMKLWLKSNQNANSDHIANEDVSTTTHTDVLLSEPSNSHSSPLFSVSIDGNNDQIKLIPDHLSPNTHKLLSSVQSAPQPMPSLRLTPKWMNRSCGANFSLGGRFVTFFRLSPSNCNGEPVSKSDSHSLRDVKNSHHQHSVVQLDRYNCEQSPLLTNWISLLNKLLSTGVSSELCAQVCEEARVLWNSSAENSSSTGELKFDFWNVLKACFQNPENVPESLTNILLSPIVYGEKISEIETVVQNISTPTDSFSVTALLDMLQYALTTGNMILAAKLCLHPKFTSLSLRNLSAMNGFACLLSSHLQDCDLSQQIVCHLLDNFCLSDEKEVDASLNPVDGHLKWIKLLFTRSLSNNDRGDVIIVEKEWSKLWEADFPLSDKWPSLLVNWINHIRSRNKPLFNRLCAVLSKRLITQSSNARPHQFKAFYAAFICAILGCDFNGLINAWLRVHNVPNCKELDKENLLPLGILLILTSFIECDTFRFDHSTPTELTADALDVMRQIIIWLGENRAGDISDCNSTLGIQNGSSNELFLSQFAYTCLRIFYKYLSNIEQSGVVDELIHRLWCSSNFSELLKRQNEQGSDMHNWLLELKSKLQCPYKQTLTSCRCGLGVYDQLDVQQQQHLVQYPPNLDHPPMSRGMSVDHVKQDCPPIFESHQSSSLMRTATLPQQHCQAQRLSSFDSVQALAAANQGQQLQNHYIDQQAYQAVPKPVELTQQPMPVSTLSEAATFSQPQTIPSNKSNEFGYDHALRNAPVNNELYPGMMTSTRFGDPLILPPSTIPYTPYTSHVSSVNNLSVPASTTFPPLMNPSPQQFTPQANIHPPLMMNQTNTYPHGQVNSTSPFNSTHLLPTPPLPPTTAGHGPTHKLTPILMDGTCPVQDTSYAKVNDHQSLSATMSSNIDANDTQQNWFTIGPVSLTVTSASSRSMPCWNDPPLLTSAYQQPRPVMCHNPFFNPSEYIPQSASSNNPPSLQPSQLTPHLPELEVTNQYTAPRPPLPASSNVIYTDPTKQIPASTSTQHYATKGLSNLPCTNQWTQPNTTLSVDWRPADPFSAMQKPTDMQLVTKQTSIAASDLSHGQQQQLCEGDDTSLRIPQKYLPLCTAFGNLVTVCRNAGGKMYQHKLDDVERRLNCFYDNLSSGGLLLSDQLFNQLWHCIQLINCANYTDALSGINQFIQCASTLNGIQRFGPGLKILLQTAKQLGVKFDHTIHSDLVETNSTPPVPVI